jgi:hypothetical protein
MMFGSYPYPGNIIGNNTIEFINVYVKPSKPLRFERRVTPASRGRAPSQTNPPNAISRTPTR